VNVAVLGFGSQGQSALNYWQAQGHQITVCDQNEALQLPENVQSQLGKDYLNNLDKFDLIVRSPSIHPRDITTAAGEKILEKTTTNTNEFFQVCPTQNIIGVTGTKGKGTTSTLISKMLEASGKKVHLGGNIGIPPLDLLAENISADDWVVLELANFQLIDLKHSPPIAVCLMVVPEHQDWHTDVNEYIQAKQQLFRWQTESDTAVYYGLDTSSSHIAGTSKGLKIPYMKYPGADVIEDMVVIEGTEICSVHDIRLLGKHNWQNICAAVTTVWQITKNTEAISNTIKSFSGMEYRLQLVRELNDVSYYNDSFGTTPETAIVAVQALEQPKVLIVGGSDKGADYSGLADVICQNNIRAVITISVTGPAIADLVRRKRPDIQIVEGLENMADVVNKAKELANPGDVVLLSTGSASFGMFKNYKDRGDHFNQAVRSLA
jgi:UDP-N-acetylmuramoylalanine--D-glutamate ligase